MKKNKSSQSSINEEFLQAETGRHSPVSEPETDSEEDLKEDPNADTKTASETDSNTDIKTAFETDSNADAETASEADSNADTKIDPETDSNVVSGSVPKAYTNIYSENREELSLREPRLFPRPVTGTSSRRSPHPFK